VSGSDYKLDSKIGINEDINEIMAIEKRMKESVGWLNESLNSIANILKYVWEAIANDLDLEEVKQTIMSSDIELYNELNIGWLNSLVEIKQAFSELYVEKEEEKDKILKVWKAQIEEIVDRNTEEAKNVDEKQKQTLKYLKSIGFDLLPQELTNKLITDYKSNIFNIPGLNLNKETLDLTNGRFWEGVTEEWWDKWKDNLVKFMEKAIYGEVWAEKSIFKNKNFKWEFWATIDPTGLNVAFDDNWIIANWSWNINVLRTNLSKKVETKDNK